MPTNILFKTSLLSLSGFIISLFVLVTINAQSTNDYILIFVIYFAIYLFTVLLFMFHKSNKDIRIDPFEPIFLVIGLYALYTWTPAFAIVFEESENKYLHIMNTYYLAIVLGNVGLLTGYLLFDTTRLAIVRKISTSLSGIPIKNYRKLVVLITILLAVLNFKSIIAALDISSIHPYAESAAAWRAERKTSWGFFAYFSTLSMTFIIYALFLNSFIHKRLNKFSVILVGIYAIITVMSGSRGIIINYVLMLLIYYHYYVRRLKVIPLLLMGILFFVVAIMLGHARVTTNLLEMANIAINLIKEDPKIVLPLSSGEFIHPSGTLMDVASAINDNSINYSFGVTYLNDLLTFIPKVLFPERPLPQPELYMHMFYPELAQEGRAYAIFLTTEGFWAFGQGGSFLAMFLYGLLIAVIYKIFLRNINNGMVVLLYAISYYSLFVSFMRTGFIGSLKNTLMYVLPFLILMLVSQKNYFKIKLNHWRA